MEKENHIDWFLWPVFLKEKAKALCCQIKDINPNLFVELLSIFLQVTSKPYDENVDGDPDGVAFFLLL